MKRKKIKNNYGNKFNNNKSSVENTAGLIT